MPEEYRDLLEYISPAAFRVVDWRKAAKHFVQMSKYAFNPEDVRKLAEHNLGYFSETVGLSESEAIPEDCEGVADQQLAEEILDIYFSQFLSDRGFFD